MLLTHLGIAGCGAAEVSSSTAEGSLDDQDEEQSVHNFSLPFDLVDRRVALTVEVANARQPSRFFFHTRGTTILDLEGARRLGGEDETEEVAAGDRLWIGHLTVGHARFRGLFVSTLDLSEARRNIGLERLDGLLGLSLFQQYVVTVDFPNRRLHFLDAAHSRQTPRGEEIPFLLQGDLPVVAAQIDGVECHLVVDLGARSSLTLAEEFVEEAALAEDALPASRIIDWGLDRPIRARPLAIESLQLGELDYGSLTADVRPLLSETSTDDHPVGIIGAGLFQGQALTIDPLRQRLVLSSTTAPRRASNPAGVWIVPRRGMLEVIEVVPESSAADLGLNVGDRIVEAQNHEGETLSLFSLREALADDTSGPIELRLTHSARGERSLTLRAERE